MNSASSNVGVGNVSIKCGLESPIEYRNQKGSTFDVSIGDENTLGNAFVGFFTQLEVQDQTPDTISIDLEDVNIPSSGYYLEVKVVFQPLYSRVKMNLEIGGQTFSTDTDDYDNPILDIMARVPLDTDSSINNFALTLTPENFSTYLSSLTSFYSIEDFYPNNFLFGDHRIFYFLVANIVKKVGTDYIPQYLSNHNVTDNSLCPGAKFAYPVKGNVLTSTQASRSLRGLDDSEEVVFCGTTDFKNGGGGGHNLFGMIVGLFLIFLLGLFRYPFVRVK